MSTSSHDLLAATLAEHLAARLKGAEPGHCVRVDDVNADLAPDLARVLDEALPEAAVHILRAAPAAQREIAAERAIEIRNRKQQVCALIVPAGEGHAASSLDNSFQRIPVLDAFAEVESVLTSRIADEWVRDLVSMNRRWLRSQGWEAWSLFLAQMCVDSSVTSFGENLWMVGLVPDHGPDPGARVERNRLAVQAISRPSRPAASMDERFAVAGLQEGPWRAPLRQFCEQRGAQLANPRLWAKAIAEELPHLTFDRWPLAEDVADDLAELEVISFMRAGGALEKWSKLKQGGDGQLVLEVPEDRPGQVTVKWKTDPPKVSAVARWELSVVPPDDLRTEETIPLASTIVPGGRRQGNVKVELDEDSLAEGTRFVVTVRALGEHGESIHLTSGDMAEADSQEFQVVGGPEAESRPRRTAAASIPEAVLRAAHDGLDDLTEDLPAWDLSGQVFSLRLGNRRAIQVRICPALIECQRAALAHPDRPLSFEASGSYGTPLDLPGLREVELVLPPALGKARAEFLAALAGTPHRDTMEATAWDGDLRDLAEAYAASYKRALEQQAGQHLKGLLQMDTLHLSVLRSNAVVRAVVVLPTHPLRAAWAAKHDRVLRDWSRQLTDISPRVARSRMVDPDLISQVVPANLPFTVPCGEDIAVYAEELTFGAGLYLVPGVVESEAAAESVATVLSLKRVGSTMRASSQMVAERIKAYESAHDPGATLRILAVNPGSGELLAGALRQPAGTNNEEQSDPRRLELLAYSDSPSFTRPVPALADLQRDLRRRDQARKPTHLAPPVSLTVRAVQDLKTDPHDAHLALMQDIGAPVVNYAPASDRQPALEDLLVPLVTRSITDAGDLVWESTAAVGGGDANGLAAAHRAHQRAVARYFTGPEGTVPSVRVVMDGEGRARITAAHARADWVIGVDRFVGVDLFDSEGSASLGDPYILDYAPDFVEGIGERLTVTTGNRREVEVLLEGAMYDLGLATVQHSVGAVLSTLAVVSGRLALRLLESTNRAREAVSLAAVVTHLRARGELDGLIIVPVDAHPEIFGAAARDAGPARRCDLLLVKVNQRSFKIECVEVKSRKEARLPQMLADHIVNQVQDTKRALEARFFANDPPRIDSALQLARLASVLHYYADRSVRHGLIAEDKAADVHRHIDRVTEGRVAPEITLRGYVISLDGQEGFKNKYGEVPLTVLTAADLGQVGFTTVLPLSATVDSSRSESIGGPSSSPSTGTGDAAQPGHSAKPTQPDGASPEPTPVVTLSRNDAQGAPEATTSASRGTPDLQEETPELPDESELSPVTAGAGEGPAQESVPDQPTEVQTVLGIDASSSEVLWRVSTQGSPHAFILGIPGQGKSVTTRHIIRSFAAHGLPSLVFDFHGDMADDPPAGAAVLNAAEGLPFSPFEAEVRVGRPINTTAWEISEIVAYVTKLGEIQRNNVYDALQAMYASHGWVGTTPGTSLPVISEFGDAVEAAEADARGRNARQRLRPMTDFGLFRDDADQAFDLLESYQGGVVVNLSQLGLEEVQMFAASFILRKIYREMFKWPQDRTMKLAVILDEAHRMAQDVTLPKLMKEGRKYGVSVVVASQNADDFHKDVLANAGTRIVFRTNYPASRAVAGYLRGRGGADLSVEIEKLGVGVAYVATPDHPQARRTYMTER